MHSHISSTLEGASSYVAAACEEARLDARASLVAVTAAADSRGLGTAAWRTWCGHAPCGYRASLLRRTFYTRRAPPHALPRITLACNLLPRICGRGAVTRGIALCGGWAWRGLLIARTSLTIPHRGMRVRHALIISPRVAVRLQSRAYCACVFCRLPPRALKPREAPRSLGVTTPRAAPQAVKHFCISAHRAVRTRTHARRPALCVRTIHSHLTAQSLCASGEAAARTASRS